MFLRLGGLGALGWLTPVGQLLANQAQRGDSKEPAQSIILLWMAGGPSQLETFDPHPDTLIAGGTRAIRTAVDGVQLAAGLPRLAEQMEDIALVRSLVSKEGDHERGTYVMKTGYEPDPTVVHPAIGAICCHQLPMGNTEIPRHVSILPNQWPSRGGFLGAQYDAFKTFDPKDKVPDISLRVSKERDGDRLKDLEVVERAFQRGRRGSVEATMHAARLNSARVMMTSAQLKAFEVSDEPARVQKAYGETPFGRGCLAARRLIEVGVRCVEVTLNGWDSHVNNHSIHENLNAILDPAFSALLRDLKERDLLRKTVVVCAGEFGRTPKLNPAEGRDHWPTGFSVALAGGGIGGGRVLGQTDPKGVAKEPANSRPVADIHATILAAVGLDPTELKSTPIGRTVRLSKGKVIQELL